MSPKRIEDAEKPADGGLAGEDALAGEVASSADEGEASESLKLTVVVSSPTACERHVTVTVPREDINRYYDEALGEMMPTAVVPGFRAGRAPRKLVEHRYRKEVAQQVKSSLVIDSMKQITDEQNFTAISEPEMDLEGVELPDDGPLTFEFDLEVRPEFDMPEWKGLKLERPVREFDDSDIESRMEEILSRYGRLVPIEDKAAVGDCLTVNISCRHGDEQLSSVEEQTIRIHPVLSFQDGKIESFDKLMKGVKAGETRQTQMELADGAPNEPLRGKKVEMIFDVLDVKKLELPELTPEFLQRLGDFESEQGFRDAVAADFKRQLDFLQRREIRKQITSVLTASADLELPQGLLQRQSARELERAVLELRRNGFSESEIRARENDLRQNSSAATAMALKEHFILERIAEEENIDVDSADYDAEVSLIALQSGESPRRVRAQLEKRDLMDVLRNQIIERKVIELLCEHAEFKDKSLKRKTQDEVEAIDLAVGGEPPELAVSETGPDSAGAG